MTGADYFWHHGDPQTRPSDTCGSAQGFEEKLRSPQPKKLARKIPRSPYSSGWHVWGHATAVAIMIAGNAIMAQWPVETVQAP